MLVTTIAITVIVAAGLLGWRAVKGDSGSSNSSVATWDEIALVDRTTGAVTTVDDSGEVVAEFVGFGRVTEVHPFGDRLALEGTEQVVIVDTSGASIEPIVIGFERGNTVTPVRTSESLHLVIGRPSGGNVVIVDVADGTAFDVAAAADQTNPLMFAETVRWAGDGSSFAVADAAHFQTIIVRPGTPGAVFLPDQPVAVGDQLVATSQTVGLQADIALVDLQRRTQAIVPSEIPAGGVMIGDRLVMVSVEGGVFRVERGDEAATQLGTIAVPAGNRVRWVLPTLDRTRLVVGGDAFQAVIDLDGDTVFTTSFASQVDIDLPEPDWSCLAIGGGDAYHSLIALESGEQLTDLTGLIVTGASSDGCTVIGERAGVTEVVNAEGTVRLGQVRGASLGPEGRTVVSTNSTGGTELLTIDDDLQIGDTIDLAHAAAANLAVAFVDS